MSVVAFKDGVLAADSLAITENDRRGGYVDKIGTGYRGSLWAFVGEAWKAEAFARWAGGPPDGQDPPTFDHQESTGILITADGRVREWSGDGWCEARAPFHAWGCGADLAIGAMSYGAGAETAVRIACEWSIACGGEIKALHLDNIPEDDPALEPEPAPDEPAPDASVAAFAAASMRHLNV